MIEGVDVDVVVVVVDILAYLCGRTKMVWDGTCLDLTQVYMYIFAMDERQMLDNLISKHVCISMFLSRHL